MSGTANLSELALQIGPHARWALVRIHFGIGAFGVNAYVADDAGTRLVGEHDELGESSGHHEELYFIADGHATFTVNGEEIDAPAGTFVFVRDPAAKRSAVATEPGTTIIVTGGRPGEAFTPSPWERSGPALVHFATKDYEKAVDAFERLHEETPEDAGVLYNLACAESLSGKTDQAVEHIRRALELDPHYRDNAEEDPDFDAIRDRPEFTELVAAKQAS